MDQNIEDLKYPIGKNKAEPFSEELLQSRLADIRFLPQGLEFAILNLNEQQLHTPYRPGGWTVHQLVHHVADSHMNAFIRFKLGYTEENPVIKPYEEDLWVRTNDVSSQPINVSLTLLHALHRRWIRFLESFERHHWDRTIHHPEHKKDITLWDLLGIYSWHSRHHTAHITSLREREGWN